MASYLVSAILGVLALSCEVTVRSELFWDNGQLAVLRGEIGGHGVRQGTWCYFDRSGKLLDVRATDVGPADGTGFYVDGVRTRLLTDVEREQAMRAAAQLTSGYRARMGRD